jgi:hypothetical protein
LGEADVFRVLEESLIEACGWPCKETAAGFLEEEEREEGDGVETRIELDDFWLELSLFDDDGFDDEGEGDKGLRLELVLVEDEGFMLATLVLDELAAGSFRYNKPGEVEAFWDAFTVLDVFVVDDNFELVAAFTDKTNRGVDLIVLDVVAFVEDDDFELVVILLDEDDFTVELRLLLALLDEVGFWLVLDVVALVEDEAFELVTLTFVDRVDDFKVIGVGDGVGDSVTAASWYTLT